MAMERAANIRLTLRDDSAKAELAIEESARRDAFDAQLKSWRARMELALEARLPDSNAVPARLHQAMRYSVLGGGKRVRPMLLFATACTLGLAEVEVEAAACVADGLPATRLMTRRQRSWWATLCSRSPSNCLPGIRHCPPRRGSACD